MQILEHNICYTNVIIIQNAILIAKILFGNVKPKELAVDIFDVEITWVYSIINVLLKYNWYLDSTDNETAINLELQINKKY